MSSWRNKRKLIDPVEMGFKGGRVRAVSLSTLELQESGRCAAMGRWDAYYRLHPEKLQAKSFRHNSDLRYGASEELVFLMRFTKHVFRISSRPALSPPGPVLALPAAPSRPAASSRAAAASR
jgi:hypothetical protein